MRVKATTFQSICKFYQSAANARAGTAGVERVGARATNLATSDVSVGAASAGARTRKKE